MPTYSFTRTREQLAVQIADKLHVLGEGDVLDGQDAQKICEGIDQKLKELHAIQTLWFNVAPVATSITLTANVGTATAPTDLLYPVSAVIRIGSTDDHVDIVSHAFYHALEDKVTTGQPIYLYHSGSTFYLNPIPDSAYALKITYEAIAADTAAATAPDVQVSMMNALRDLVTYELSDTFSQPEQRVVRFAQQAVLAEQKIRKLNNPKRSRTRARFSNF